MSIPLKYRKVIKEALPALEGHLKEASELIGAPIVFEDNTAAIYAATAAVSEDEPEKMKYLPDYGSYLLEAIKTTASDDIGKESLAALFNSVGGKVKFLIRDPSVSLSDYYKLEDNAFGIEIRSDALGAWGGYYSAEYLQKLATSQIEGASMSLAQRKNLKEAEGDINTSMQKVSKAFGSELQWDPDYGKLWNFLVANSEKYVDDPEWNPLGRKVKEYVEFFSDTLAEFLGNPDNKEAVEEKLTAKKLGFSYLPANHSADVDWAWEDGKLCLQVKGGSFGCWITTSYYSLEKLEATL